MFAGMPPLGCPMGGPARPVGVASVGCHARSSRRRWPALVLTAVTTLVSAPAGAVSLPLQVDGLFADWGSTPVAATDAAADGGSSGVDFRNLYVANDDAFLVLRFDTTGEVQPDEGQSLRLYLDTDLNAGTGQAWNGIGADLVWNLGARSGTFYTPSATSVGQAAVGLLVHTTVSGTQFELALPRNAVPAAGKALFPGSSVRIVLRDAATGGDVFPNTTSVTYTFDATPQPVPSLSTARTSVSHIRVGCYNVENDGLFDGGTRDQALDRMFDAADADVWVITEVWNHEAADVVAKLQQYRPSGPGQSWHAVKQDDGDVIVSRFPIVQSWAIFPGHRLSAALLDLSPVSEKDLLVVANHWRCCTADDLRQEEADALVAFLRDARTPGGVITLAQDTPMIAMGDFNLVGWAQQLVTLQSGDIVDNGTWGVDSPPDWDGSALDDVLSRHIDARLVYTWRNDGGSFYPGRLDWIFYTGSAASVGNHFVLETRTMKPATLTALGLQAGDTPTASDHAPHVADLLPVTTTAAPPDLAGGRHASAVVRLLPAVPNPFNPSTQVRFVADAATHLRLDVLDARGRRVRTLLDGPVTAGEHALPWDGRDGSGVRCTSGVYRVVAHAAGAERSATALLLLQ